MAANFPSSPKGLEMMTLIQKKGQSRNEKREVADDSLDRSRGLDMNQEFRESLVTEIRE